MFLGTKTVPFIVNTIVLGIALVTKVTILFCFPSFLPLLKVTLIMASFPAVTASFGHSGTVHPQLPLAERIKSGAFPIFFNLNSVLTYSS